MRVVPLRLRSNLPTDPIQRLFVECWYSLVEKESLDSYRVKCMYSLNIIKELRILIEDENLSRNREYIKKCAKETIQILSNDMVVGEHFSDHRRRLKPLLGQLIEIGPKNQDVDLPAYYLKAFQFHLESTYEACLLNDLRHALLEDRDKNKVIHYISSLVTHLVDCGFSLTSLHDLIWRIFIQNSKRPNATFKENFNFLMTRIGRDRNAYEVVIRLSGGRGINSLPMAINGLELNVAPIIPSKGKNIERIMKPGQTVFFAKVSVKAKDERGAGLEAKNRLYGVMDIIRFELEPETVSIHNEFICIRTFQPNSVGVYKFPAVIPNPSRIKHGTGLLETFNANLESIYKEERLSSQSKDRIKSALRFYRMGRDGDIAENKFLNWWTALEYLTVLSEEGPKIIHVENNFVSTMVVDYLRKHSYHLKKALSYCEIEPQPDTISTFGKEHYKDLSITEFIRGIRTQDEKEYLLKSTTQFPMLNQKLSMLIESLEGGKELLAFLKGHEQRLSWHINRIYRLRNLLVHNAQYSVDLTLIAANLEYYLKSVLMHCINVMAEIKGITSLSEVFARTEFTKAALEHSASNDDWDQIYTLLEQRIF